MTNLRDAINENVLLTVPEGDRVTCLEKVQNRQAVVTRTTVGTTASAHCVSSGKAMLAYHPEFAECPLTSRQERYSPHTIVDSRRMRKGFETIRVHGYALNKRESRKDVCGVDALIFSARGLVAGATSTATPA